MGKQCRRWKKKKKKKKKKNTHIADAIGESRPTIHTHTQRHPRLPSAPTPRGRPHWVRLVSWPSRAISRGSRVFAPATPWRSHAARQPRSATAGYRIPVAGQRGRRWRQREPPWARHRRTRGKSHRCCSTTWRCMDGAWRDHINARREDKEGGGGKGHMKPYPDMRRRVAARGFAFCAGFG